VPSSRETDCDTDNCLVFAEVREKLVVSKQESQKFDEGRFDIRKLNELEFRKQCKVKISKRFAYLENLNENEEVNRAWENIKENISTSANEILGVYELRKHKPRLDEEFLFLFFF